MSITDVGTSVIHRSRGEVDDRVKGLRELRDAGFSDATVLKVYSGDRPGLWEFQETITIAGTLAR
jgi:hypothetical protein